MGRYYDSAIGANAATVISLIIVFAAVAFFKGHTWKLHKEGREPPRTKRAIMSKYVIHDSHLILSEVHSHIFDSGDLKQIKMLLLAINK
jgi:hypothetical protein